MKSEERHEIRYQRRKAARLKRKEDLNKLYGDFDKAISVTELMKAFRLCRANVGWKPSVQRYGFNLYKNSLKMHNRLKAGEDTFKGFYQFEIYERGKKRKIRSIHISERCVEKSLAKNSYVPMLGNSLIYDNSASLKGRGTEYARKRLLKHLRKWYHFHGTEGYVIIGDFTTYFDTIDHDVLLDVIREHFTGPRYADYTRMSIEHYGDRGLGLGSELNQIYAISVPNKIDHYIKCKLGLKYYHRYNDDFYIFCETKEEAHALVRTLKELTDKYSITLSDKKTYITKISKGFAFLKKRYILTDTGYVITKHYRRNITYERKKLKKFKEMYEAGRIDYKTIEQQYRSWRGYLKYTMTVSKNYSKRYKNEYRTIRQMDKLFNELFIIPFLGGGADVYSHQY